MYMKQVTSVEIRRVFEEKGYSFFSGGPYDLNIYGIRSNNSQSNKFDDIIGVIYEDSKGILRHKRYAATTDPGLHWLLNPLNVRGTAILVPGQYRGAYRVGIHGRSSSSGGYTALEQKIPMRYVRDNNLNSKLDFSLYENPSNIFSANIKTNIHRAHLSRLQSVVEKYSAGCQVIQDSADFLELLDICKLAIAHGWNNSFTYTLLEERDFAL
jgi:hypothetical protein